MKNLILNSVRIRPSRTETECVEVMPSQGLLWIKDEKGIGGHYSKLSGYHYVYTEESQEDIYIKSARPMVERFLSGMNSAVLAYGQSGSGKKYTIGIDFKDELEKGFNENTGIIPRSITDIFNYIKEEQEENPDAVFSLKMTFLCIFQEEFIDLLADNRPKSSMRARSPNPAALRTTQTPSSNILVRDLGKKGIVLTGLKEEKILSVDMLLDRIIQGWSTRNSILDEENSIRSHTVLSFYLIQDDGKGHTLSSKIHFAHLAGSEK
eukprot:jgi/Orpsp1_1/1190901/evm.model.d7180000082004.1